jgi:hypothetical protein
LIIACNSCPAQYSVPDAKVRGKKVRITCKHCSAAIIVDATQMPAEAPVAPPVVLPKFEPPRLELADPAAPSPREDDVTLIARPKPSGGFSVHDEPTVIGQIPREALEFERAFAQRTLPPPAAPAPASEAPVAAPPAEPAAAAALDRAAPPLALHTALPEMPERADDETMRASPRAFAMQDPVLVEPAPVAMPVPVAPTPRPLAAVRDEATLISGAPAPGPAPSTLDAPSEASRGSRGALIAFLLLAALLLAFAILKPR